MPHSTQLTRSLKKVFIRPYRLRRRSVHVERSLALLVKRFLVHSFIVQPKYKLHGSSKQQKKRRHRQKRLLRTPRRLL